MIWGDFRGTPSPGGQQDSPIPPSLFAGSCLFAQTTLAGDAFHPFSICTPVPLGRCRGCQPVQLGVRCGTAVPQLRGTPSTSPRGRARAAESGSPRGFTKLLRSPGGGSIPKCLPAAVFSTITAPAKGSPGCRPSRPEHRLSHSHSCPQCPVQGPAGLLCTGTGHDDTDFYVIPREPIWFQTQALDHLICIFRHSRVPG